MNEICYRDVKAIPLEFPGTIKATNDSLVIKIPDELVVNLYERLNLKERLRYQLPPYFPGSSVFQNPIGAHITLINRFEKENITKKISSCLTEGTQAICIIKSFNKVKPQFWKAMEKIQLCTVKVKIFSSKANKLISAYKFREKLGLSRFPNNHEFHFTYAVLAKSPDNKMYFDQESILKKIQNDSSNSSFNSDVLLKNDQPESNAEELFLENDSLQSSEEEPLESFDLEISFPSTSEESELDEIEVISEIPKDAIVEYLSDLIRKEGMWFQELLVNGKFCYLSRKIEFLNIFFYYKGHCFQKIKIDGELKHYLIDNPDLIDDSETSYQELTPEDELEISLMENLKSNRKNKK